MNLRGCCFHWQALKKAPPGHHGRVTADELRLLITTAAEIPELQEEAREILSNVFEFRVSVVEEIMVPAYSHCRAARDSDVSRFAR